MIKTKLKKRTIRRNIKRTISYKKITAGFALLLVLGITACKDTIAKTPLSQEKFCRLEIRPLSVDDSARSAHPTGAFPTTWYYEAVAEEDTTATPAPIESEKVQLSSGISLMLERGKTYNITLNAYVDETTTDKVAIGNKKFSIPSAPNPIPQCNIALRPVSGTSVKGAIELEVDFSAVSDFDRAEIESSSPSISDLTIGAPVSNKCKLTANNVDSGTYDIKLRLKNSDDKIIGVVYLRDISIEPGRTTKTWTGSGTASDSYAVEANQVFKQQVFYVKTGGADSNNGLTAGTAFGTLQYAVNKCTEEKIDYLICIVDSIIGAEACAEIKTGSLISIVGTGTTPTLNANKAKDASGNALSVLHIENENAKVTLRNIKITGVEGAHTATELASGIFIKAGTCTLDTGSIVTGNTKTLAGGGVWINGTEGAPKAHLIMKAGSKIENNRAWGDGGGVNIDHGSFVMQGGEISGNRACTGLEPGAASGFNYNGEGGGVRLAYSDAGFTWEGGTIQGNYSHANPNGSDTGTGEYGKDIFVGHQATFIFDASTVHTLDSPVYLAYHVDGAANPYQGKITLKNFTPTSVSSYIDGAIKIKPSHYAIDMVLITAGEGTTLSPEILKKFSVTKDGEIEYTLELDGTDGKLKKIGIAEQTLDFTGGYTANDRWKKFKKAVADAKDGGTIKIKGEVIATNDAGNNGLIEITEKSLTIEGDNKANDIINANCYVPTGSTLPANAPEEAKRHGIFKISGSTSNTYTVTIRNLTLKGGKNKLTGGGAMSLHIAPKVTIDDTDITGNKCTNNGGAVFIGSGSFTMTGTSSITNNEAANGGGVYVDTGDSFVMEGGTISGNTATNKGSGVYVNGSFSMKNNSKVGAYDVSSTFDNNYVYLPNGKKITITGTLSGSSAASPAAIIEPEKYTNDDSSPVRVLQSTPAFSGLAAEITKFAVKDKGTEKWQIKEDGTLEQKSAMTWADLKNKVENTNESPIIIDGKIEAEAGDTEIIVKNGHSVIIKGKDNSTDTSTHDSVYVINANCAATSSIRRIFKVESGGSLTIQDITLTGGKASGSTNSEKAGGAVVIQSGGTFTMKSGATITGNTAVGPGGAVSVGGTFKMENGTIKKNTANATNAGGGGIYIGGTSSSFTMSGGTIKENTAKTGGGVYVFSGTFTMSNGTILENTSTSTDANTIGNGVYVRSGTMNMSGGAKIGGGTKQNTLGLNSGCIVTTGSSLTGTGTAATIAVKPDPFQGPRYTTGTAILTGSAAGSNYNRFEIKDQSYVGDSNTFTVGWELDTEGKLKRKAITTWDQLRHAVAIASNGETITLSQNLERGSGDSDIVLKRYNGIGVRNVTVSKAADASTAYILLDAKGKGRIFDVQATSTLTLDTLELTGGSVDDDGGAVKATGTVGNECNLTLKHCKIHDNTVEGDHHGGGLYVHYAQELRLENSQIKENHIKGSGYGAGLFVSNSKLTMTGVSVEENSGTGSGHIFGGGLAVNGLKTGSAISGGAISLNEGYEGAGIYEGTVPSGIPFEKSELTISGISINKNNIGATTKGNRGGGLFISGAESSFTLKGVEIAGNEVNIDAKKGGGIFISNGTVKLMDKDSTETSLFDNKAVGGGAGIWVEGSGKLQMQGKVKVGSSSTGTFDNNYVYLAAGKTIDITGDLTVDAANPVAIIVPENYPTDGTTVTVLGEASSGLINSNCTKFKVKDNGTEKWQIKEDGTLEKMPDIIEGSSADDGAWGKLQTAINNAADGDTIYIKGEIIAKADSDPLKLEAIKSISIKPAPGESSATINAENKCGIFQIGKSGASDIKITIENIILKKGIGNSTGKIGAAVNLIDNGSFIMNGSNSSIEFCSGYYAVNAGAFQSSFTMNAGTFSNNDNGDVKVGQSGSSTGKFGNFIMNGGTINGKVNESVFIDRFNSKFSMKGAAKISGGYVLLRNGKKINITGAITANPAATIWPQTYPTGAGSSPTVLGDSSSGSLVSAHHSQFKVKDDADGNEWTINSEGKLKKKSSKTISAGDDAWKALQEEVQKDSGGVDIIIINGSIMATGWLNRGEITVKRKITIKGNDPDNDKLDAGEFSRIFNVEENGELILKNLTLLKGKETPLTGLDSGGAILVNKGNLTMNNCVISNCTVKGYGGAIAVKGSEESSLTNEHTVSLTKVTMKENKVTGSSDGKKAGLGGALYVNASDFNVTLNDCIITNNTVSRMGLGIHVSRGKLTLNGGKIDDNKRSTADDHFLGITIWPGSPVDFSMDGAVQFLNDNGITLLYDNSSVLGGGGSYGIGVINLTEDLSGTAKIKVSFDVPVDADKVDTVVLKSDVAGVVANNHDKFEIITPVPDEPSKKWIINDEGKLKIENRD